MIEFLTDPHVWASFLALSAMEIVLGIDNVVFISVMVSRMAPEQRLMARRVGLSLALDLPRRHARRDRLVHPSDHADLQHWRLRLLVARPRAHRRRLVSAGQGHARDPSRTSRATTTSPARPLSPARVTSAILQIALIDLVFSVDSIITAVGMADHIEVMIAAVAVAILVMYFASGPVAAFIERHPTTKMLALSFLLLIGAALIADGFHFHIPRGYIYFAMAFSGRASRPSTSSPRATAKGAGRKAR